MIDPREMFDLAPGEPLFPPVARLAQASELTFRGEAGSRTTDLALHFLRLGGSTVLEYAADAKPEAVQCAEHASGVGL